MMTDQRTGATPADRRATEKLEHVPLTLPRQQRLDALRKHNPGTGITVNSGPGGTVEATVELGWHTYDIYDDRPDDLLDAVELVIGADPDTS